MACQFPVSQSVLVNTSNVYLHPVLQYAYVSGEHLSRVEPKRKRHVNRPIMPQIYNYFDDMDGDMPFFRGGRDYTYMPGDPSYTPRSMRDNWPPY